MFGVKKLLSLGYKLPEAGYCLVSKKNVSDPCLTIKMNTFLIVRSELYKCICATGDTVGLKA